MVKLEHLRYSVFQLVCSFHFVFCFVLLCLFFFFDNMCSCVAFDSAQYSHQSRQACEALDTD